MARKSLGAVLLELAGNLLCRVLGKSVHGRYVSRGTLLQTPRAVLEKVLASVVLPSVRGGSQALDRLCAMSKHTRPGKENSREPSCSVSPMSPTNKAQDYVN